LFGSGVLDPHGPIGNSERLILFNATAIMLAVVVPVIICTLAFAWWYRATNTRAKRLPQWAYSGRIEFVTWAIPALIVLFLSGIAWIGSHELDPPKPLTGSLPSVEIQVVSLDWKWLFIYPDERIASVNELVVPIGAPLHFRLTSSSVMNSFFVPQLGSQIYTMAGMVTQLNLRADNPGSFAGLSAQFSGDGFSDMRFELRAVPEKEYIAWISAAHANKEVLTTSAYAVLSMPSSKEPARTYGSASEGIFDAIVAGRGSLSR
jgi:cytochrome o ubiquinol oxidase subunit II